MRRSLDAKTVVRIVPVDPIRNIERISNRCDETRINGKAGFTYCPSRASHSCHKGAHNHASATDRDDWEPPLWTSPALLSATLVSLLMKESTMSMQVQNKEGQNIKGSRRIVGIDLGVTARHRAAILNPATNHFVVRSVGFRPVAREIDALLRKARQPDGSESAGQMQLSATLEATHMSWYLVSHYLQQQGVTVYRVNGRMTKQLRRVATPHAQSDAIDAQVLARLPGACPEQLYPLTVPMVDSLALKRYVLEYARWRTAATAIKNRLTAYDHAFWPGIAGAVPAKARDWVRENWFDP